MTRFINRDYRRSERDDWTLNVQPVLEAGWGSVAQYDSEGIITGWVVKPIYE